MDCSLPGSSNPGIFQARVLEWVAISFSTGSLWPRDWTQVSCIAGRRFTIWTTRESGYIQVCNGGSRQSEHQRSASKLRSLAFFVWEDASLWAWIHSFPVYLSYLSTSANPVSLFTLHLASPPTPTSSHCRGGSIRWTSVLGALFHIWRPESADGCDSSCLLIGRRYVHFTVYTTLILSLS